ncbi:YTH domain-containing protein ECT4-like isoform X2 [Humulus lupulus]|uniref:YTH domain-containing protein ECT4-like isoform X2 n=1 Tax=Humulus lupulus TaxID=3486 RepID=UPI002B41861F|nr:YTH domain-containing protein ECT4-like isoform X2 [Humulus lupulus]
MPSHFLGYDSGYENPTGSWSTYPSVYNQYPSVVFQSYGHTPQMSYRPYVPSSMRRHGQLYSPQPFPTSDYQSPVSPNVQYGASLSSVTQAALPIDLTHYANNEIVPLRRGPSPLEYSGGESNLIENFDGFSLMQQGFERLGVNGLWSDESKPMNDQSSLIQLSPAAASSKQIALQELPGVNLKMAFQHEGLVYGSSSCTSSYQGYYNDDHCRGHRSVPNYSPGIIGQTWSVSKEAHEGGRHDLLCGCTGMLATQTAQNRGPRALKQKSQSAANSSIINESKNRTSPNVYNGSLNLLDSSIKYRDAKFFVIKSYSEDNVHRSIKYSVWASTPSGNKKLDAAYHEAKENEQDIPIFLLFSVNASAQFCGVAEMVGPVDFVNSVDYWQQDKWTGQFPVKWHIIKDVPNSQFRHIIVKGNDNKPVTNSRDTQEVELQLGIDMLNIFKNYEALSSILDDFNFYEERQKSMRERKAGRQANPASVLEIGGSIVQHPNMPCHFPMSYSRQFYS